MRPFGVWLLVNLGDIALLALELGGERRRGCFVKCCDYATAGQLAAVLQLTRFLVEVATRRDALAVYCVQVGRERDELLAASEGDLQAPVVSWHEAHALAFALDDDAHRDTLHAAGTELRLDLLPQQRRDRVAVEAVDQTARLLRFDQMHVDLARILKRLEDRGLGDLVKHQALGLTLRLQLFEQVPRNRLSFTVFICREVEAGRVLDHRPELFQVLLLLGRHDVEGFEVLFDVDAELRPFLTLEPGRYFAGRAWQVADVSYAGFDAVVRAEVFADRSRFGGRFDNHDGGAFLLLGHCVAGGPSRLVRGRGNQLSRISAPGTLVVSSNRAFEGPGPGRLSRLSVAAHRPTGRAPVCRVTTLLRGLARPFLRAPGTDFLSG